MSSVTEEQLEEALREFEAAHTAVEHSVGVGYAQSQRNAERYTSIIRAALAKAREEAFNAGRAYKWNGDGTYVYNEAADYLATLEDPK